MGLRIDIPDVPYHVFARGNNKQPLFWDKQDRLVYLKMWRRAKEQFDFLVHSFVLMDNHIHFLLQMLKESRLSQLMHHIHRRYAVYINRKYQRVGHLFERRYHSILVQKDSYFLTVDRYVHLNPVKAGMVCRPEDYPWSSYRDRWSSSPLKWIAHEQVLDYFGKTRNQQLASYKHFTNEAISQPEEWNEKTLRKMEYFGSPGFIRQIRQRLQ